MPKIARKKRIIRIHDIKPVTAIPVYRYSNSGTVTWRDVEFLQTFATELREVCYRYRGDEQARNLLSAMEIIIKQSLAILMYEFGDIMAAINVACLDCERNVVTNDGERSERYLAFTVALREWFKPTQDLILRVDVKQHWIERDLSQAPFAYDVNNKRPNPISSFGQYNQAVRNRAGYAGWMPIEIYIQ
jgi:hypothetical protein